MSECRIAAGEIDSDDLLKIESALIDINGVAMILLALGEPGGDAELWAYLGHNLMEHKNEAEVALERMARRNPAP